MKSNLSQFETMDLMNGSTAYYLIPNTQPDPQPVIIDATLLASLVGNVGPINHKTESEALLKVLQTSKPENLDDNLLIFRHVSNEVTLVEKFRRAFMADLLRDTMAYQVNELMKMLKLK